MGNRSRSAWKERRSARVAVERTATAGYYSWPEELAALLGKISDRELARRAGVSVSTVEAERRRRGIEPFEFHDRSRDR